MGEFTFKFTVHGDGYAYVDNPRTRLKDSRDGRITVEADNIADARKEFNRRKRGTPQYSYIKDRSLEGSLKPRVTVERITDPDGKVSHVSKKEARVHFSKPTSGRTGIPIRLYHIKKPGIWPPRKKLMSKGGVHFKGTF